MIIKTKKQLNLSQLIEWLLNSKYSSYIAFSNMGNYVQLEEYGALIFSETKFYPEETFTVEVEEEITEDTRLEHTIEIYKVDNIEWVRSIEHNNMSISKMKDRGNIASLAFYILNDDMTMTPIWTREKGMVE